MNLVIEIETHQQKVPLLVSSLPEEAIADGPSRGWESKEDVFVFAYLLHDHVLP